MSEAASPINVSATFTDTSVLYDYSKDETEEAAIFFDEYTNLKKYTSDFGYREYKRVAQRRAKAYAAWEESVSDGNSSIGDYQFDTPSNLTSNDRRSLNDFQRQLVQEHGDIEALRLVRERLRQYESGVDRLFGNANSEPLVERLNINYDVNLYRALQMDISNTSDCKLLAQAAKWYATGGDDAFVTSDKNDFGDEAEPTDEDTTSTGGLPATLEELTSDPISLQQNINQHVSREYSNINGLSIYQLNNFVERYSP
ncbi:hypothetical protein [Salinigranum rubrum]|uniref:hypothetical protein n=1 Tax=Salinigranum rubrum TaxID=755307 RepID=UPI0013A5AAF2|nr:hypothetical protein [Salinigranum rubrum]